MLETKEQKQIFAGCVVLIIILGFISFWHRPDFQYAPAPHATSSSQDILASKAYLDYLNSLQISPAASKELFQQIITKEDIKKEVEQSLQTNQEIVQSQIEVQNIKASSATGQKAILDYLTNSVGPVLAFNKQTGDLNKSLFDGESNAAADILSQYQTLRSDLVKVLVPKEALSLHKDLLASFEAYGNLLKVSGDYAAQKNTNPWPAVYAAYASINQSNLAYSRDFDVLQKKYQLSRQPPLYYFAESSKQSKFSLIPKAQAFLGFGDVTITIGDIPSLIMDAVKQGLVTSFSRFMGQFLEKIISKIESNYVISNFLYYSDALVAGQYTDDYLNKYVSDSLDRNIIKTFIPQLSCGAHPDLGPVYQAKANQYLGFDPNTLDPKDPNFYQKLARVGDFMSSPQGWQLYYQDLARQAESEAQRSVDRELGSSGLKTPRDTVSGAISASINSIVSAEQASFGTLLQLGIFNADSVISSLVSELTQNLVNKFVFSGAVVNNGNGQIGVLKDQPTCLAAAQFKIILPISPTQYQTPPPAPSANDLFNQECIRLGACPAKP